MIDNIEEMPLIDPDVITVGKNNQKSHKPKIILFIALIIGFTHYYYVSHLFENDRNFSHLSELEREMTLRSEMGFYYSFYKLILEEKPFFMGITKLMYNKLIEYPAEVNSFNRFNIHPEVMLASLYRYVEPWLNGTRQCFVVVRGEGLAKVESCSGLEEPILFYLEGVWILAGVTAAAIFALGAVLSGSILGGLTSILLYYSGHSDATRVQWSPNERENFAQPVLLLQMLLLTVQSRRQFEERATWPLQMSICVLNCICLLFWQFSQFIFLTQLAIFFMMDQLRIIDIKDMSIFLHGHFCGLHMAILLLQGNDMLKSSLYTSFFVAISLYSVFLGNLRLKVRNTLNFLLEIWLILIRTALLIASSFWLKNFLSEFFGTEEDTHIWQILDSKFSEFKNFHTLLYTCSEVYDFMSIENWKRLIQSGLLPMSIVAMWLPVSFWLQSGLAPNFTKLKKKPKNKMADDSTSDDSGIDTKTSKKESKITENKMADKMADLKDLNDIESKFRPKSRSKRDFFVVFLKNLNIDPAVFYNLTQMIVFGLLAAIVMRLKVLFVPQICVVSALIFTRKFYYIFPRLSKWRVYTIWSLIISVIVVKAAYSVKQELNHQGEFSDIDQEELLLWIEENTDKMAVFAASMPLTSSIMLSTRRAIVNHPHYENALSRERNYAVYKAYSRVTPSDLYRELNKLKATHLVLERRLCYGVSDRGCSFTAIWDVEMPHLSHNQPLCDLLLTQPTEHFYRMFVNENYAVFRIHDLGVNYMPRSFYT